MNYKIISAFISPLLLIQAALVKLRTPKLIEPKGERTGKVGDGLKLKLLLLGDSAAAGVGADSHDDALIGQVSKFLKNDYKVFWHLDAMSGNSSSDLLREVKQMSAMKSQQYMNVDAVIISIGVNDVTSLASVNTWKGNIEESIEILNKELNARKIYLSKLPPMHLFPALPQPLRWVLGRRALELDFMINILSEKRNNCSYVDASFSIEASNMASDGFHPGKSAYCVWGKYLGELIAKDNEQRLWNSRSKKINSKEPNFQ